MSQVQLPQSLIETHADPLIIINRQFELVAVNCAWESAFEKMRDAVLGRTVVDVFGIPADVVSQFTRQLAQTFRTLKPYTRVVNLNINEGGSVKARVRGYPLTDDDGNLYIAESLLLLDERNVHEGATMLGESTVFATFRAQLDRAAKTDISVLLSGATGTGKDVAARYIHTHSARNKHPFVIVDGAVMNEDRFELELFGDDRPGAVGGPITGLLELANGGTLFLNDVCGLAASIQAKLLRVLETGEFRRVGGCEMQSVDLRIICASSCSVPGMVEKGHFREDLFYRIAVFAVDLPALAERSDDIPLLAKHLLGRINAAGGTRFELSPKAINRLMMHSFPGNIRELHNILQLSATLCDANRIEEKHIHITGGQSQNIVESTEDMLETASAALPMSIPPLREVEARYVEQLLQKFDGRRSEVARTLGVSERTLYRKLKQFGLN